MLATSIACILILQTIQSFSYDKKGCSTPSVTNDDFCDCINDEFLTSACSNVATVKFSCEDKTFFNEDIFLSRVDELVLSPISI